MEINDATRLLAHSFVAEMIKKKKLKKASSITEADADGLSEAIASSDNTDLSDISFGELENYYKKVVSVIENTPEIRESVVDSISAVRKTGADLNEFYPATIVAKEESLQRMLFFDDGESSISKDC